MIPKIETATLAEIKTFQEQKLMEVLSYVNEYSTFYKELFSKNNIDVH
jgi:phenylacetate-CoA ligase